MLALVIAGVWWLSRGPETVHLEPPGGGGFAEVDQTRHQLLVCDTTGNGRSVTVDYTLNGNGDVQHRMDDNGARPGCGEVRLGDVLITTVRVCESDAGKDPECTDWVPTQEA